MTQLAAPTSPTVRRPGAVGLLDIDVAKVAGATRVVRQFHHTPLYLLRPLYLDAYHPGMAFLYMQQHGDGLVQGDRYRIDVTAAEGSQLHLTTQATTKVYGMELDFAAQLVNITAGPHSVVEYLPDPVIPFRRSRFFGRTTLTIDPSASVICAETLLPGRTGECHDYDLHWTTTQAQRPNGQLLLSDTLSFGRALGASDTPARLGPYRVHATLFIVTASVPATELCATLLPIVAEHPGVLAGVSTLPAECGVGVRILGHTAAPVRRVMRAAWQAARIAVLGAPVPDLRKG